jgi:hypothetical protein
MVKAMGFFKDSHGPSWLSGREPMYRLNHPLIGAGHHFESFTVATITWFDRYGISVSQMTTHMYHLLEAFPGPFLIHDLSMDL